MVFGKQFKVAAKKLAIMPVVRRLHGWLQEVDGQPPPPVVLPFDNTYDFLRQAFSGIMKDEACSGKPMYVWGVLQGAALAKVLQIPRISVIEFGVGGGWGLICLERIAERCEAELGVAVDVYGFDTGAGLPDLADYRDQPNMWFKGQIPMDPSRLKSRLGKASLRLGLVRDTLPQFLVERPAPIAFVSVDVDLYSSTRDALALFDAGHDRLLPRVFTYFDDFMGHSYSEFCGERLAISEFNGEHRTRKLSPVWGLRYFVPKRFLGEPYWDGFYMAHFFDHPLYGSLDTQWLNNAQRHAGTTKTTWLDVDCHIPY
jgi:hypothetical protein